MHYEKRGGKLRKLTCVICHREFVRSKDMATCSKACKQAHKTNLTDSQPSITGAITDDTSNTTNHS